MRKVKIQFSEHLRIDLVKGNIDPISGWYSRSFLQKQPTTLFMGSLETKRKQKIIFTTLLQII